MGARESLKGDAAEAAHRWAGPVYPLTADAAKAKAAFADVEKRAGSLQNQMGNVAKAIGGAFATQKIIGFANFNYFIIA